jgi:exopolysaccharide biosynthesis polyprenyl glycosylphosphotransferase
MFYSDDRQPTSVIPAAVTPTTDAADMATARDLRSPAEAVLRRGFAIGWGRILMLLLLDLGLLFFSWQVAQFCSLHFSLPWDVPERFKLFPRTAVLVLALMGLGGLYGAGNDWRPIGKLLRTIALAHLLAVTMAYLEQPSLVIWQSTRLWLGLSSLVCLSLGRGCLGALLDRIRLNGVARHPVFIFCEPDDAPAIVPIISQKPHYAVLGWNDVARLTHPIYLNAAARQRTVDRLCRLGVEEIFLCAQLPPKDLMLLYWELRNVGITLHLSTVLRSAPSLDRIELPSITFYPPLITGIDFLIKRGFDFVVGCVVLLLASPIYLVIALLIKLDSPGAIFFQQTRIGLHGQPFKVWKFRTMVANADDLQQQLETLNETKDGVLFKIKHDPRITKVGKVLRRYSLDELPQIFNVILGEMSFVGPRPLPTRDVAKFTQGHFIRHEVLPGITGLWQVSGRSDIDNFEDVLNLDMLYIQSWSLWLDLKIMLQTVQAVLGKSGAY